MRPVPAGKSVRMSFSRQKEVLEMPNLIEVQKDSYQWFLNEGLKEVFSDISPIADYNGRLSLEFVDFALCEEEEIKTAFDDVPEKDFGLMLFDMDYSDKENISPMFFRAVMKRGVIDLQNCEVIR